MMWTGGPQSGAVEPVTDVKSAAADFNWLLNRFATKTAGVVDVIGVSSDGLLIAVSQLRGQADSERLSAIVSGITSLAMGASGNYGLGGLNKVIIDLEEGHVLVSALGQGAVLGVVASKEAKLGNIAYEMTLFANRAGAALSPQLVMELKNTVGIASAG
jgi:predicted regulator of Ras-like GTPase activity (Roadblock/LC7/MglB family)